MKQSSMPCSCASFPQITCVEFHHLYVNALDFTTEIPFYLQPSFNENQCDVVCNNWQKIEKVY